MVYHHISNRVWIFERLQFYNCFFNEALNDEIQESQESHADVCIRFGISGCTKLLTDIS